jgi:hypothetical protein
MENTFIRVVLPALIVVIKMSKVADSFSHLDCPIVVVVLNKQCVTFRNVAVARNWFFPNNRPSNFSFNLSNLQFTLPAQFAMFAKPR